MGLFSFGKKEKVRTKEEKQEKVILNKRRYDRYIVNHSKVLDISKNGIRIKKETPEEIKTEFIEVKIDDTFYKGKVIQDKTDYFSIELLEELTDKNLIKKSIPKLDEPKEEKKETFIDFSLCSKNDEIRAIINLLAELEDQNTTSNKLITYITQVPQLEEEILELANSVEEKVAVEIKNLNTAIARLGFNKIKKIVRDVVNRKISIKDSSLINFEYFEAYNILKTVFFKEVAPLFSFNDVKNEGRTLLSTETAVFSFFTNTLSKMKDYYTNPLRLYNSYSRYIEKELTGIDFIELGKQYFVDYLGFFKYLYDGYILAHQSLNPEYDLGDIKLTLSNRKLRFSYVCYLSFLATIGIIQRDRKAGYILLNRLSRFGMETGKTIEFINSIINASNNGLSNMGLRRSIRTFSIPTYSINLKKIFPENLHFDYLTDTFSKVSYTKRAALRHEDRGFISYLLGFLLNAQGSTFLKDSFCIIPCKNIDDEELSVNLFEGFDTIIFKDIDLLKKELLDDFKKIWLEFEGNIIATYSTYSFLDFDFPDMYSLLRPYVIDFPSYFNTSGAYGFLKEKLKEETNEIFEGFNFNVNVIDEHQNKSLDFLRKEIVKTLSLFR